MCENSRIHEQSFDFLRIHERNRFREFKNNFFSLSRIHEQKSKKKPISAVTNTAGGLDYRIKLLTSGEKYKMFNRMLIYSK